jgi:hypothetical protein
MNAAGPAQAQRPARRMAQLASLLVIALSLSTFFVMSVDQGQAYADDLIDGAIQLLPVTEAGTLTVGAGCVASGVCEGLAAGAVVVAGAGVFIWGARQMHLFGWGSHTVERPSFVGYSTTSTYGGGCWSLGFGSSFTCNDSTKQVPQDGITGTAFGATWTLTVEASGARATSANVVARVSWNGTPTWDQYDGRQLQLRCVDGTYPGGTARAFLQAYNDAGPAVSGASGSNTYTLAGAPCAAFGGISTLDWLGRACCGDVKATYRFSTATPTAPVEVPAPSHRWRGTKICVGTDGTESSVIALSARFKEADSALPAFPNPACAAGTVPKSYVVDETAENGTTVNRTMITWTAPNSGTYPHLLTSPSGTPSSVDVSDCLPGGSAAPCHMHLLHRTTTTSPWLECAIDAIDCTAFDTGTSTTTLYQCVWGTHSIALAECVAVPKTKVEVETPTTPTTVTHVDTDPGPTNDAPPEDPTTGTGHSCMGQVNWNPVTWVLNPVKCALKWAFVPQGVTVADLALQCDTAFPCNAVKEGTDTVGAVVTGATGGLGGSPCGPTIGFDHVGTHEGFQVQLPSPAGGCAGSGTDAANLLGFRTTVRTAALVFLWVGFLVRMYKMLPWAKGEDVPGEGLG